MILISVKSWANPRAIIWLQNLGHLKNPMTFRLVAQCVNQLPLPRAQEEEWTKYSDPPITCCCIKQLLFLCLRSSNTLWGTKFWRVFIISMLIISGDSQPLWCKVSPHLILFCDHDHSWVASFLKSHFHCVYSCYVLYKDIFKSLLPPKTANQFKCHGTKWKWYTAKATKNKVSERIFETLHIDLTNLKRWVSAEYILRIQ
jgi:hypothetical protein